MKKHLLFISVLLSSFMLSAQSDEWMCFYETYSLTGLNADNDYIWAASHSGITRINKANGECTWFDDYNSPLPERNFHSLTVDSQGNKWFCSNQGYLVRLQGEEWTVYESLKYYLGAVTYADEIVTGNGNDLWILGNNSIVRFNGTNWYKYTTANSGLPSNYIQGIYFADGILWVGWNNTITRFDGNSWVTYTSPNEDVYAVSDIKKDNSGNLWILHNRCIEKFDGNTFTLYDNNNTNLPDVSMNNMVIDTNNVIWVGCRSSDTVAGGILRFSDNYWSKYDTSNSQINDTYANNLYLDLNGEIWFGNFIGDIVRLTDTNNYTYYDLAPSGLDNHIVNEIITDNSGNAYIGTDLPNTGGYALYKTNLENWTGIPFYKGKYYTIATDTSDNLYIKYDKVYKYVNNDTVSIPGCPYIETSADIHGSDVSLIVTDEGHIWMDYTDKVEFFTDSNTYITYLRSFSGIAWYNGSTWTTYNSLNSPLPLTSIADIEIAPDGSIWVSTEGHGLVRFSDDNIAIYNTTNSTLPDNHITDFVIDNFGNLWFTNGNYGLYRFDGTTTQEFVHPTLGYATSMGYLAIDLDGSIWQRSAFNLTRFDGTQWTHNFTLSNSPLCDGIIYALAIDRNGNKWIGSREGFVIYREGGLILGTQTEFPKSAQSVNAYPNPFTNLVTFAFGKEYTGISIMLYNASGKRVYNRNFTNTNSIDVKANLKKGTYIYQIKTNDGQRFSGKLVSN